CGLLASCPVYSSPPGTVVRAGLGMGPADRAFSGPVEPAPRACLDEQAVLALLEGEGPRDEALYEHLASCPSCAELLATCAGEASEKPVHRIARDQVGGVLGAGGRGGVCDGHGGGRRRPGGTKLRAGGYRSP